MKNWLPIDVVEVAEKQLNEVELYTTKAFEGGNDARSLLDTSMQDLAKVDREQVKAKLAQGLSLDEAAAEFETEAYFDAWFTSLTQQMQEIVKK